MGRLACIMLLVVITGMPLAIENQLYDGGQPTKLVLVKVVVATVIERQFTLWTTVMTVGSGHPLLKILYSKDQ